MKFLGRHGLDMFLVALAAGQGSAIVLGDAPAGFSGGGVEGVPSVGARGVGALGVGTLGVGARGVGGPGLLGMRDRAQAVVYAYGTGFILAAGR